MDFLNVQPVYMASSIKDLSEQAKLPPFDQKTKVELRRFINWKEVYLSLKCTHSKDLEQAYILLLKFAMLVVERIPKHKGYAECISPLKKQIRSKAVQVMNEMDTIKSYLNKLYEEKQQKEEQEERQKLEEAERQRLAQEQKIKEEEEEQIRMKSMMQSPIVSAPPPMTEIPLNPTSMWFPESAPPPYTPMEGFPGFPTPPEGVPPGFPPQDFVPPEFTGFAPQQNPEIATSPSLIDIPNDELTSSLPQKLDVGNLQKLSLEYQGPTPEPTPENILTKNDVAYPSPSPMGNIPNYKPSPKVSPMVPPTQPFPPQMPPPGYMFPPQPMAMPPGFPVYGGPVPMGAPMMIPTYSPVKATAPAAPPKPVDSPKKETTPPTPKKSKLRAMNMDGGMFQVFMDLAKPNTVKDIETCGILAGTLKNNAFQVTTLIIPKQTGTSDTCAMTHEDELFQFQQDNNLMTLGWIHTHPSHDCFLSSVDMHTHMSYQLMLDEAVAVVVAPKVTPNFGIFRLNEFGMADIQSCEKRGFHPHQKGLYNTTDHVNVQFNGNNYKVVDLRKK